MNDLQRRARSALFGLAMGDALCWPAMFHRSRLLPSWPRRLRREMEAQEEETGVLRIPMPFSLNQPAEVFDLCPTDDTEWAAWTMDLLLDRSVFPPSERTSRSAVPRSMDTGRVTAAWIALARSGQQIRAGVSTAAALENLRRGLLPPRSGQENPHYFDDGAACRAVPIGLAFAGDPGAACRAAASDASVTNYEDGVWTAQAVAAAVSTACAGEPASAVIDAALEALPPRSWSRHTVEEALRISGRKEPAFQLIPLLHDIVNKEYSYGSVGPETLALTLGIISRLGGNFEGAVTMANAFAKTADALPALVGALSGAIAPQEEIGPAWRQCIDGLRGISIPAMKGRSYLELVDTFVGDCLP